ncbi:MAG: DUF882 domain-containing protein [Alphaproteobacteria bacterium]|nr:MAG: DUF882 domain-containing protein [Alphaproteobacteria bacterium]
MLTGFARQFKPLSLPKAGYQFGLTSLLLLMGAGSVHDATALNETRTLSFHHTHSEEDITVTFKRDGRYDEEALKQLNHYLRDWRSQEQTTMDRRLFDILWEVYRDVDGKKPIHIISSYRSPATNAMLHRRSSGVARFSQHMLGHAMDFFIPDVPLEQIRYAGLRLQRGGVGFYPTSGSPFVHLDTGSIRHWPRMTHDQLARVFPDGRTVHLPSDGNPLIGYELARADIEKRGNGGDASTKSKPSLFAALFRGKSNDEDDEGAAAPMAGQKSTSAGLMAAALPTKSTQPVAASTFQLASADVQSVQPPKAKQAAAVDAQASSADKAEAKPQTPADIINARGFWDDAATAPKQLTPALVAAINARQALVSTDPQSTASVFTAMQALAYAPASSSPVDRGNIVAASAPIPRSVRPTSAPRSSTAVITIDQVVAKGPQGPGSVVATSTRIAASNSNDVWMRMMILAPSASMSMSATVLGDTDMTLMRAHFVKPQSAIAMSFSDDPQMGLVCDRFTGSATATLATHSFVMRTALLR